MSALQQENKFDNYYIINQSYSVAIDSLGNVWLYSHPYAFTGKPACKQLILKCK